MGVSFLVWFGFDFHRNHNCDLHGVEIAHSYQLISGLEAYLVAIWFS